MGGGKAGVELDRLLKFRDCAIGAARPHADETERKMGVRIPGVERNGALRELVALAIAGLDIVRPTEIGRVADGNRQRRHCLRVLRIDRQSTPKIRLRVDIVRLAVPVVVPHTVLVKSVGVLAVLRPLGNSLTFELQNFRLDRAGDSVDDLVL